VVTRMGQLCIAINTRSSLRVPTTVEMPSESQHSDHHVSLPSAFDVLLNMKSL